MSPPGRPKVEYRSAQHEGNPMSPQGRHDSMRSGAALALELHTLARGIGGALQRGLAPPAEPGPALLQPPAATAIAAPLLARSHAGTKARHAAQALYSRCLADFRRRIQRGAALDDAGLGAAYFVLANLDALHGLSPGEAELALIERQVRHWLNGAGWHAAPLRDRQSAFEQLALLGTLVAESAALARRQGPAAVAHVQQAARAYLVQLLGLNPDRLRLAETGLVLDSAAA